MTEQVSIPAMIAVGSSNIHEIGYQSGNLFIRFRNGTLYMYKGVPQNVYDDFFTAESMGAYFSVMIRGAYISEKLTGL